MDNGMLSAARIAEIEERVKLCPEWDADDCEIEREEDGYIYVPECATIPNTLIQYAGDCEDGAEAWNFIAHAREDVPALLADRRALADENERLREAVKPIVEFYDTYLELYGEQEMRRNSNIMGVGSLYKYAALTFDHLRCVVEAVQQITTPEASNE